MKLIYFSKSMFVSFFGVFALILTSFWSYFSGHGSPNWFSWIINKYNYQFSSQVTMKNNANRIKNEPTQIELDWCIYINLQINMAKKI